MTHDHWTVQPTRYRRSPTWCQSKRRKGLCCAGGMHARYGTCRPSLCSPRTSWL